MYPKAIGGSNSLDVVQYAYRQALSQALVGPAVEYLRQVLACDTRRAARPGCNRGLRDLSAIPNDGGVDNGAVEHATGAVGAGQEAAENGEAFQADVV